jgi:hypothetical protein
VPQLQNQGLSSELILEVETFIEGYYNTVTHDLKLDLKTFQFV